MNAATQPTPAVPVSRGTSGNCFIFIDLFVIMLIYAGYAAVILKSQLFPPTHLGMISGVLFHIFFFLQICSFYRAVKTNPGVVPPNWGFYMGDMSKRRRYCKMCNLWKPERTHHCSVCGRCVLNMDHHCPWINNCVGFYNRKFFLQLLFYTIICLSIIIFQGFFYIFENIATFTNEEENWRTFERVYVCLVMFGSFVLLSALVPFSRFHLNLASKNSTTIESLSDQGAESRRFNLGTSRNLAQVFGRNILCWWAPWHTYHSRPVGDGVRWNMYYNSVNDEESG